MNQPKQYSVASSYSLFNPLPFFLATFRMCIQHWFFFRLHKRENRRPTLVRITNIHQIILASFWFKTPQSPFSHQKNHKIVNHEIWCNKCNMKLGFDQKWWMETFYSFSRREFSLIWKTETHFVKGILHKVDSKVKKLYHSANLKLLICVHTHFKPPFFSFSNRKVMHTLLYGC